ncbi:MAG: hypothetical protein GY842_01170 [bacterium]|nr:hypothetical protein [bacterium]
MGKAICHEVALLGVDEIFRGEGDLLQDHSPVGCGEGALAKAEAEGIPGDARRRTPPERTYPGAGRGALSPLGDGDARRARFHLGGSVHEFEYRAYRG